MVGFSTCGYLLSGPVVEQTVRHSCDMTGHLTHKMRDARVGVEKLDKRRVKNVR